MEASAEIMAMFSNMIQAMACTPKPAVEFNGEGSAKVFLEELSAYLAVFGLSDKQRLYIAQQALIGPAREWYSIIGNIGVKSFKDFTERLCRRYPEPEEWAAEIAEMVCLEKEVAKKKMTAKKVGIQKEADFKMNAVSDEASKREASKDKRLRIERERKAKEDERQCLECEKKSEEERQHIEHEKKAEEERQHIAHEKKAEEKRHLECEKKAEEERQHIEHEKKAEEERLRIEHEMKAEEERQHVEHERKAEEERQRVEHEMKAEEERQRIRKAEQERQRVELEIKTEAERRHIERERKAEEERFKLEEDKKAAEKRKEGRRQAEEKKGLEERIKERKRIAAETRMVEEAEMQKELQRWLLGEPSDKHASVGTVRKATKCQHPWSRVQTLRPGEAQKCWQTRSPDRLPKPHLRKPGAQGARPRPQSHCPLVKMRIDPTIPERTR